MTTKLPVVAPLGTAAWMLVALQRWIALAGMPLKVAVLLPWVEPMGGHTEERHFLRTGLSALAGCSRVPEWKLPDSSRNREWNLLEPIGCTLAVYASPAEWTCTAIEKPSSAPSNWFV